MGFFKIEIAAVADGDDVLDVGRAGGLDLVASVALGDGAGVGEVDDHACPLRAPQLGRECKFAG